MKEFLVLVLIIEFMLIMKEKEKSLLLVMVLMVLQQVAVQVAIVDKLMETITIGDTTNITATAITATATLLAKQIPLPSKCADTPEVFRVCSYISTYKVFSHIFETNFCSNVANLVIFVISVLF